MSQMGVSLLYTLAAVIVFAVLLVLMVYALKHGIHGRFVYVPRGGER